MVSEGSLTIAKILKILGDISIFILGILWFQKTKEEEPLILIIASIVTFLSNWFIHKKEYATVENLREENQKLKEEIDKTKNQILNEVTGGDSIGIVSTYYIAGQMPVYIQLIVQNMGIYPLYDVTVRYKDPEKLNEADTKGKPQTIETMRHHRRENIGNIPPKNIGLIGQPFPTPKQGKLDMSFTIVQRNGVYHQKLAGRMSTKHPVLMTFAYQLGRNKPEGGFEILKEFIPPDFPSNEVINWEDIT